MRRRHRVALRPKVRTQRARRAAAAAAVLLLAGAAAAVIQHLRLSGPGWQDLAGESWRPFKSVRLVGPEEAAPALEAAMEKLRGRPPREAAAELERALPYLAGVRVRRAWLAREIVLEARLRRPVARVPSRGARSWLDETGTIFAAPEPLFDELELPAVDPGAAGDADRATLGRVLSELALAGQPAPERARWAAGSGWELTLADGTAALWGDSRWTREKLTRLAEALRDARAELSGALIADLRYFEDGKILVRTVR